MTTRVLCVGEALIDIVHRKDNVGAATDIVGGSPFNVANGLSQLDHDTTLACWIGQDERGERIVAGAQAAGTTLADGSRGAPRTSTADAALDETGQASYTFDLEWQLPRLSNTEHYTHLHTGSIAVTLEPGGSELLGLAQKLRDTGVTISYDPNVRPALMHEPAAVVDRIEAMIALSDVVKASDEDIDWLYPHAELNEVLERWNSLGPRLAVVTRGPHGARVALPTTTGAPQIWDAPQRRVEVIDTVGAGDSFMAGLVSALLDAGLLGATESRDRLAEAGRDQVRPAIERALATSALTVARAGAHAPSRADLC